MAQIAAYTTLTQYTVNTIVTNNNKLYRFGTNKGFKTVSTVAEARTTPLNSVVIVRNGPEKYLVLRNNTARGGPTMPLPVDIFSNDNAIKVSADRYWQLITDGADNNGALDNRYWETLGTFNSKDIQHLNNAVTDANISVANLRNLLLILSPEKYSATIFQRLEGLINSIDNVNVRNRLLGFIEFQKKGFVNRDDNGTKRSRVTPTAPFAIPGIIDYLLNQTREFSYGKYHNKLPIKSKSYRFKGKIIGESNGKYKIAVSTILLRNQQGKWIEKYRDKSGAMEELVNDENDFFQEHDFWEFEPNDRSYVLIEKERFSKWTKSQLHYLRPYFYFVHLISDVQDLNLNMARDQKKMDDTINKLQRLFQQSSLNYSGKPMRDIELKDLNIRSPYDVKVRDMIVLGEHKLFVTFTALEDFSYDVRVVTKFSNSPDQVRVYSVKGNIRETATHSEIIPDDAIGYDIQVRAAAGSSHTNNLSRPHNALAPSVLQWNDVQTITHTITRVNESKKKAVNKFRMQLYDVDKFRLEIEDKYKTIWDVLHYNKAQLYMDSFESSSSRPNVKRYSWDDAVDVPSDWNNLDQTRKVFVILHKALKKSKLNDPGLLAKLLFDDLIDSIGNNRFKEYIYMSWDLLKQRGYNAGYVNQNGGNLNDEISAVVDGLRCHYTTRYPVNNRPAYSGDYSTEAKTRETKSGNEVFAFNNQNMDHTFMLSLDFNKKMDEVYSLWQLGMSRDYAKIRKNKVLQSLPCVQLDMAKEKEICVRLRRIALCLRKSVEVGYPVVLRHAENPFDSAYNDVRSNVRGRRWTQGVLWESLEVPGTQRMGRLLETDEDPTSGIQYKNALVMQEMLGTGPLYDVHHNRLSSILQGPTLVKVRESSGTKGVERGVLQHPLYPSKTKARTHVLLQGGGTQAEDTIALDDVEITDRAAYTSNPDSIINIEL